MCLKEDNLDPREIISSVGQGYPFVIQLAVLFIFFLFFVSSISQRIHIPLTKGEAYLFYHIIILFHESLLNTKI